MSTNEVRALSSRVRALHTVPSRVSVEFAEYVREDLLETFDAAMSPNLVPWDPYSPVSILLGRGATPMLIETGALRASIDARPRAGAGVRVTAGGGMPYAVLHRRGTSRMPARDFFPQSFPKRWRDELDGMIAREWSNQ